MIISSLDESGIMNLVHVRIVAQYQEYGMTLHHDLPAAELFCAEMFGGHIVHIKDETELSTVVAMMDSTFSETYHAQNRIGVDFIADYSPINRKYVLKLSCVTMCRYSTGGVSSTQILQFVLYVCLNMDMH